MNPESITIDHALGSWTVEILTGCTDVPEGCKDWHQFGNGFTYKGHATAYLKRLAKHTPDKSSRWVVYEFRTKWYVAYREDRA